MGVWELSENLLEKVACQVGLEGQLGWEAQRGGKAFRAVAQVKVHTTASFRPSIWVP